MTNLELIKIREDKKLSKADFAKLIGITAMMQGRYESGKISIPEELEKKILALAARKAATDTVKKEVKKATKKAGKKVAEDALKAGAGAAAVGVVKKGVEKKSPKKTAAKTEKKAELKEKKTSTKSKKKSVSVPKVYIESLLGGTITPEEVLERVPNDAENVYIKPEENKAYWVRGDESGDVELWS